MAAIIPGTSVILVEDNAIGSLSASETMNPCSPLEAGKTVAAGTGIRASKVKTNDADGKLPYAT